MWQTLDALFVERSEQPRWTVIGNPAHPGIGRESEGLDSRSSSIVYLFSLTRSAFSEKSVGAMHKVYEGMLAVAVFIYSGFQLRSVT